MCAITFILAPNLFTHISHIVPVRLVPCHITTYLRSVSACPKAGDGWHGEWRESEIEALRVRRVALRDMTSIYKRRFLLRPTALEIFYNDDSTGSKIRRYELTSSVYLKHIYLGRLGTKGIQNLSFFFRGVCTRSF